MDTNERCNNIRDALLRAAELFPQDKAIEWYGLLGDKSITFNELKLEVISLYGELLRRGWKGKHIAILGGNSAPWVISYLTVLSGLGIAVPIAPNEAPETIRWMFEDGDVEVCLTARQCQPLVPQGIECFVFEDIENIKIDADNTFDDDGMPADAMCEILYTSGTTGRKRGVMLTNESIACISCSDFTKLIGRRTLSCLPFFHGFEAVCHLLTCLTNGTTMCLGSSTLRFAADLVHFQPESVYLVPLQAESLLGPFAKTLAATPTLKTIVCGGAPLRPTLASDYAARGIRLLGGYGLSECSPLVSLNEDATPGSVGIHGPFCQVRIADADADGNGEIQVKGTNVMLGYYKNEEATAAAFTEDGWLKTGDLGKMDEQEHIYIVGRIKNVIVLPNGENVVPEELEEKLSYELPSGTEVIVSDERGILTATVYSDLEHLNELSAALRSAVEKINKMIPSFKRIGAHKVSTEQPERTALGKIKRNYGIQIRK